jgi:thiol-disulfide isomerase/thioredoxin
VVGVVGTIATGCADDDPAATDDVGDVGERAALLDFRLPTVEGDEVDASTLADGDVVVWFWSPWCGSCAATADGIGRVAAELGDEVAFLGIAAAGSQDEYEAFLADHDLSAFPQLVDDTGEIWLRFGADTIRSSFFFLDDTGATSRTGYGELDEDALRERVTELITS